MNILVIITSCVALGTSLVSVVVVITNLRTTVTALVKQEERITGKIEGAAQQFTDLLIVVKSFISAQTVMNEHLALGLQGQIRRSEESRAQQQKSDGVSELLAEVLRHKKIVDIG